MPELGSLIIVKIIIFYIGYMRMDMRGERGDGEEAGSGQRTDADACGGGDTACSSSWQDLRQGIGMA